MFNPHAEIITRLDNIERLLLDLKSLNRNPHTNTVPEKLLTTREVCEFLGITEPTLIRRRKKGQIPFLSVGGSIRFDKAAIIKALEKKSKQHG